MSRRGFPPDVLKGILLRDGEQCAMLGAPGCPGHRATEGNHRLNRGQGGSTDPIIDDPANGCAIEHHCNWALEVVAEFAEEGRRRGVKLEVGADPRLVPLWSPFFQQWIRFDLDARGSLTATVAGLTGITDPDLDARRADEWLGGVA